MSVPTSVLIHQAARRRTFAIISHPDAGKTTLTEKLLLFGGAIHLAGAVRAKRNQRHTTSDWMELERERGISVNTTVLQFETGDTRINLLDTPGHEDFSEDTYRTVTAADSAVMLIDAAKGVESRTRKLFEVASVRGLPIVTFVNKIDRPGREPLELVDEIEQVLGIRCVPLTWPIGMGWDFRGLYDRRTNEVVLDVPGGNARVIALSGPQDPKLAELIDDERRVQQLRADLELLEVAGEGLDLARVHAGKLTPVFFGSALTNFGVERFLHDFVHLAPSPRPRPASTGDVAPEAPFFSAFVFKLQANMDPQHRDRVAFLRVCSGRFERNMTVKHARLGHEIKLARPLQFFGQDRVVVDEAWPGDILGMVDTTDTLRIGDTLTDGPTLQFEAVPAFSPEHFGRARLEDPLRRKALRKGLDHLAEEGVVQLYLPRERGESDPILGAVGALQFDVLAYRLEREYRVPVKIERLPYIHARWVEGAGFDPAFFDGRDDSRCLVDRDGHPVVLFASPWALRWAEETHTNLRFVTTAPLTPRSGAD